MERTPQGILSGSDLLGRGAGIPQPEAAVSPLSDTRVSSQAMFSVFTFSYRGGEWVATDE